MLRLVQRSQSKRKSGGCDKFGSVSKGSRTDVNSVHTGGESQRAFWSWYSAHCVYRSPHRGDRYLRRYLMGRNSCQFAVESEVGWRIRRQCSQNSRSDARALSRRVGATFFVFFLCALRQSRHSDIASVCTCVQPLPRKGLGREPLLLSRKKKNTHCWKLQRIDTSHLSHPCT